MLSILLGLAVVSAPVATVVATSPSAQASVASGDIVFDRSSGTSMYDELMLRRGSDGTVVDLGVVGTTPSVSPDGSRIAFINANGYLSVMNSDGSGVTQIRQDDPAQHFVDSPGEPQWSADGQWIAFVEQTPEGDGSHYSIRKIKPDGSSMTILADGIAGSTGVSFDPTWSPDGSKIAFSTDREAPGSTVYQIYIMNASDGSNQHRIEASNSNYNDTMPIWGPDGNRIYFWSARPGGGYLQYYASTDGFNSVTVSQVPGSNTVTTAGFRLSPDGSTVVFQGGNAAGCFSLFTLPTVGGTPTLLTGNDCSQTDTSPTFVSASYTPTPTPTPPTPTPTPTISKLNWVALGDSYSSGEGNPPFLAGSHNPGDECHRSLAAYSEVIAQSQPSRYNLSFHACSGAVTADLYAPNETNEKESTPQLDWLNSKTDVVTLTIGGNDVGFPDVMSYCATRNSLMPTCQEKFQAQVDAEISLLGAINDEGDRTYRNIIYDISQRAPNAKIYILGYPRFFPEIPPLNCPTGAGPDQFAYSDMVWMNEEGKKLDNAIAAGAAASGATYVDTYDAMAGHTLCDKKPWINRAVPSHRVYSYHPTADGQKAFARILENHMG
jgi:lysophospholipase L1-like esterase